MKELERHIKKHYHSESLTKEQLNLIVKHSSPKRSNLRKLPNLIKYAAIIVIVVGVVYSLFITQKHQQTKIVTAFAEEIAFNHKKQLPPELKTSNLFELNSKMDKLDFELFLPKNITSYYKLQGGRYCSVGNRIAAQLKLKDSKGKIATCYVFKKLENFDFEYQITSTNILVTIWDNDTLIFAIATD